jgi:glycosyltransferase involved in cell wall biosynthesis
VLLSVVIITYNEEANLARTLDSLHPLLPHAEVIVLDSGSSDSTVEIARQFGATVFVETWKGFSAQKNSALDKATGDWILSLDADESLEPALAGEILEAIRSSPQSAVNGYFIPRKNHFLGRWIKHGGYWPDSKLRLFRRNAARFEDRLVHEDARLANGATGSLQHALIHHSYPTISEYIEHMNRYSSLGAQMALAKEQNAGAVNIVLRPLATVLYNYFLRLGFLDGREGLLLHLHHGVYVWWKYAKLWELKEQAAREK